MLPAPSIRTKLLVIVVAVTALHSTTLFYLSVLAKRHIVQTIQDEMLRTRQAVTTYYEDRYANLEAGLGTAIVSNQFQSALSATDQAASTRTEALEWLRQITCADMALLVDLQGTVIGSCIPDDHPAGTAVAKELMGGAFRDKKKSGFIEYQGQPYSAVAMPAQIGGEFPCVVCIGLSLDNDASQLRQLLYRDLVLRRNGMTIGSHPELLNGSVTEKFVPLQVKSFSNLGLLPKLDLASALQTAETEAAIAATTPVKLSNGNVLHVTTAIPRGMALGFYDEIRQALLLVGLATFLICSFIAFYIAASFSRQVRATLETLERVAAGDLTTRLEPRGEDEFGRIAKALNTAIESSHNTLQVLISRIHKSKMLLDSVQQGFFTVNASGQISDERSGILERIFGPLEPRMRFSDFIAQFDPDAAEWIELGLPEVFEQILPVEVTLDQLPTRFRHGESVYSIAYSPVLQAGQVQLIAVVIDDITAQVRNEKLEAEQKEMMEMVHRITNDRNGYLEFFYESNDLMELLRYERLDDVVTTKRRLHTLKGNCAIYGLHRASHLCHRIEHFIAEHETLPDPKYWQELFEDWDQVSEHLRRICGQQSPGIEIPTTEFDALLKAVSVALPECDLPVSLAAYKLEKTEVRLGRICEQLKALAKRLGKGEIDVEMRDNGLRLDPNHWADFWLAFAHIVRNAVDHGLEPSEQRVAKSKPVRGCIMLETALVQQRFVLTIQDDGRGIDWSSLQRKAAEWNVPGETRDDLVQLMFTDGVSTAEQITETSGRGVGLAAVRETCSRLQGTITIESEPDQGTTWIFSFPIEEMAPSALKDLSAWSIKRPERVVTGITPSAPIGLAQTQFTSC